MQGGNINLPTFIVSLVSLVIGTSALVLSMLDYLRDRSKVTVTLQWNVETVMCGAGPSVMSLDGRSRTAF
jgi:hypothetical protein